MFVRSSSLHLISVDWNSEYKAQRRAAAEEATFQHLFIPSKIRALKLLTVPVCEWATVHRCSLRFITLQTLHCKYRPTEYMGMLRRVVW